MVTCVTGGAFQLILTSSVSGGVKKVDRNAVLGFVLHHGLGAELFLLLVRLDVDKNERDTDSEQRIWPRQRKGERVGELCCWRKGKQ